METERIAAREVWPAMDDHLVQPETRAELVEGRRVMTPPAQDLHAEMHARLATLVRMHVASGWTVGVDKLMRLTQRSDFAPDVAVYRTNRAGIQRHPPLLSFEVVSKQGIGVATRKARVLIRRGAGRVFCLRVKQNRALEWLDGHWRILGRDAEIDVQCLARPLPVAALLDAALLDQAVVAALIARGSRALRREIARGATRAEARGLREAVADICELLSIRLTPGRRALIERMTSKELRALRTSLKRERRWPR